jgi:hypothetical protein
MRSRPPTQVVLPGVNRSTSRAGGAKILSARLMNTFLLLALQLLLNSQELLKAERLCLLIGAPYFWMD